jgi:hypothetical protein
MITKEELKYIAQLFSEYMVKEINNVQDILLKTKED